MMKLLRKKSVMFKRHERFKEWEDVKYDGRSRREEKVQQLLRSDRMSIKIIAEELKLDRETVRRILTEDLETRKISVKMVPTI